MVLPTTQREHERPPNSMYFFFFQFSLFQFIMI